VMERIGYKKGILVGLGLCACGALLFLPASSARVYWFFLLALFVMACGQSFLEVAANPYVTVLGPAGSAERRLNFAQSFNAVGAMLSPIVGRTFILTGVEYSPMQMAAMSAAQLDAYRTAEASTVKGPYVFMAGIFVFVALLIQLAHLPEVKESAEVAEGHGAGSVFAHPHLIKGVIAQFFYVGAQVGVASFVIRYAQFSVPGMAARTAAWYLLLHQTGFMVGRFVGSGLMKKIAAPRLLALFAGAALVCCVVAVVSSGVIPVWAVVLIGFFHSIMFPTIFALSIKDLGALTKRGSSLLVMAIVGGALLPMAMGKISDLASIQRAFLVPVVCYGVILYFAVAGYRVVRSR
jgi:MFS transporter, FHS family, L-fucose permease